MENGGLAPSTNRVAVVQAASVAFDLCRSIEKLESLATEAAETAQN